MMSSFENIPFEWFILSKQPRSLYHSSPMSRPVSKSFNRISDFIFPDTVHIHFPSSNYLQQQQERHFNSQRHQQTENYNSPVSNPCDLIIVEHLPVKQLDNVDMLYREKYDEPNQRIRRRYPSNLDEQRLPLNENTSIGSKYRSTTYRDKQRDKRKRHTTDNVYHSLLKSMLDKDHKQQQQQQNKNVKDSNYILSYKTTLDPITDSESMASIDQRNRKQYINGSSRYRSLNHGTLPVRHARRERVRQMSSTISTRDSSSDTECVDTHPKTMNSNYYQYDSPVREI